jgi:hypothetical protein
MREQIRHLITMAGQPNVVIHVLPFAAGAHAAMDGPFCLLSFPEPEDPDLVYLEQATSGLVPEEPGEVRRYTLMFGNQQVGPQGREHPAHGAFPQVLAGAGPSAAKTGPAVHRTARSLAGARSIRRGDEPAEAREVTGNYRARPAPSRKILRKARAAHPDRRAPGRNFSLERAADAGGGSPRRLVQGSGPHRVRMARGSRWPVTRPPWTGPRPAWPVPGDL